MAAVPIDGSYDVAVIGGGIHGVGVAQAAAAAGYHVLLVEQTELAAGTSSRSSKLIHGGLRYLENGEFRLVYECLHERELLLRLAPALVHRRQFFLPLYRSSARRPWYVRLGLMAYWALAGFGSQTGYRCVPRQEWDTLDGLSTVGLQAVLAYTDAQTDDRQLTCAVMASAQSLGAVLRCPGRFVQGTLRDRGCELAIDGGGGREYVRSRVLVNAAGPWANEVLGRIQPPVAAAAVELVQGTHLEIAGTLQRGCYYCEAPADRRAVFVMPWKDRTLVGTTERTYRGDPADVVPLPDEVDYLQQTMMAYFPDRPATATAAWAGLRVLPASQQQSAFRRSRETQFVLDNPRRPQLLSIFGGKLTTYRATAERVMRRLRPSLPSRPVKARTSELPLSPAP